MPGFAKPLYPLTCATLRTIEIIVSPDGNTIYVANALDDSLSVIDARQLAVTQGIGLGGPSAISKTRFGEKVFHSARNAFQQQFSQQYGIGVTPYQSLQGGLLAGKYRRGQTPPADSRAAEKPDWVWKQDDALFDRLEAIAGLAAGAGVPMAQYALAWTLAQPAMSSAIVGVKSLEQIQDASAATDIAIPPEHLPQLDAICPPPWRQPDPIRG